MPLLRAFLRAPLAMGNLKRRSLLSFGIKLSATGLAFVVSVLLSRTLGLQAFGTYTFAISVAMMAGIPSELGLPTLMVRSVVRYRGNGRYDLLKGLLQWSSALVALTSTAAAILSGFWIFFQPSFDVTAQTVLLALLLIPIISMTRIRQAAMQGMDQVLIGQIPEYILLPILFLSAAGLAAGHQFGAVGYVGLYVGCAIIAFVAGIILFLRIFKGHLKTVQAAYETREWFAVLGPLAVSSLVSAMIGTIDIVLLGLLAPKSEVGLYKVAISGAALVAFPLSALHAVIQPRIAAYFHTGDITEMSRLLVISARVTAAAGGLLTLLYIVAGRWIITLIFGMQYAAAWPPLVLLGIGQFIMLALGSMGMALNMAGLERLVLRQSFCGLVLLVVLNFALVPILGATGAAIAAGSTNAAMAFGYWWAARNRIGINGSILGTTLLTTAK